MKCWIRRYDSKNEIWKDSWFAKHLWKDQNHWTIFKQEAKEFESVKEARWFIKFYNLKNCEVKNERNNIYDTNIKRR